MAQTTPLKIAASAKFADAKATWMEPRQDQDKMMIDSTNNNNNNNNIGKFEDDYKEESFLYNCMHHTSVILLLRLWSSGSMAR
jgi:hypothetical protein